MICTKTAESFRFVHDASFVHAAFDEQITCVWLDLNTGWSQITAVLGACGSHIFSAFMYKGVVHVWKSLLLRSSCKNGICSLFELLICWWMGTGERFLAFTLFPHVLGIFATQHRDGNYSLYFFLRPIAPKFIKFVDPQWCNVFIDKGSLFLGHLPHYEADYCLWQFLLLV